MISSRILSGSLALAAIVAGVPAIAQTVSDEDPATRSSAAKAADSFSLDLPEDAEVTAPEAAAPSAAETEPAAPASTNAEARFSADTPIEQLIANSRSRAILDRDLKGISTDKNLPKFQKLSLRQLVPLSGGRLTTELLDKVDGDLKAIR